MSAALPARPPGGRPGNLFETTTERLLASVRLGEFPPGSRLPAERELAATMGVARNTLREALSDLRDAGYLTVTRGRYGGTHVAAVLPAFEHRGPRPTADDVHDLLCFRAVVEPAAARLAAQHPHQARTARLQELQEEGRQADDGAMRPLDARLHLTLGQLSGSPSLAGAVTDVGARLDRMLAHIPRLTTNLDHSHDQHERIVLAVLAGRPDAAEEEMRLHLEGTAALLRGFLT